MEWVEVQGKSVDLAVSVALGELGLSSVEDAQIEVIQEPKPGFLGMGGREAIVKVTRAPKRKRRGRGKGRGRATGRDAQRNSSKKPTEEKQDKSRKPRQDQNNRKRRQEKKVSESQAEPQQKQKSDRPDEAPIETQATVAAAFISGLLEAFGLEGAVNTRIDDDVLYLDVTGEQTEALIGPKGSVMYSVLELTRTVVQRKTYGAPRMRIDIGGYVQRRREALKIYAGKLAEQIIEDQNEVMLESMNPADRKVVHDAVAEIDGVRSYSEGDEPRRAVVIAYSGDE